MNSVEIEVFSAADQKEVSELIITIQQDEFKIPITLEKQPDLQHINTFYQVGKGNFWVAKIDDKVIGTIALLDIGDDKSALRKMFVAKEYRGKEFGAGQKLLDKLLDWCKEKKVSEIFLGTTEKFIAAQRFYERNGFIEISNQDLPIQFPVMDVDVKFYKIDIAY